MSKKNVINPKVCRTTVTMDVPNEGAFVATCELPVGHEGPHIGLFDQTGETTKECECCKQHVTYRVEVTATWGWKKK